MTRIAHVSDLHGNLDALLTSEVTPDVWVISGDLCPNESRGDADLERMTQVMWLESVRESLVARFGTTPVVYVGGNHDYADVARVLRSFGIDAVTVTPEGVEVVGVRFAGFPEIPFIAGEWNNESHDLAPMVEAAMAADPEVLVTHAAPAGILDDDHGCGHGCGVRSLTSALAYAPHRVRAHLFGHIHASEGVIEEMGITFSNASGVVHTIDV
jgi:Icc-related predicted phosphoesterase